MGLIILRLLKESSPVTALCPPTSKRLSPLTENGSICCLLLNHMRQLHSRCPHGRWTSRSSSSSSATTFLNQAPGVISIFLEFGRRFCKEQIFQGQKINHSLKIKKKKKKTPPKKKKKKKKKKKS